MVGTYPNATDARRVRRQEAAPKSAPPAPRVSTRLVVSRREYSNLQCGAGEVRGVVVDASDRLEHWPVLWDVLGKFGHHMGITHGHISGHTFVTDPLFVLLCRLALEHVEVNE
jgi:hypothetical protein